MIIRSIFHFLLCAFCMVLTASAAYAQKENANSPFEVNIIDTTEEGVQDEFVLPTRENLSKLYWAIGKLDFDDNQAIDNYLLINECNMYLQFYHNDFEWEKIREATRDYLRNGMDEFPTRYELIAPINLGRYNVEDESFEIEDQSKILGMRRIDFTMNDEAYKKTCGKTGAVAQYPANMIVILNRPITLEKVPVKRELAELYIEEAKRFYDNMTLERQIIHYERMAFLRLKVWVTQYKNTVTTVQGDERAVVFGRLEGYEIYADPDKKKPLHYKDIKATRFKRIRDRRREAEQADQQQQSEAPSGKLRIDD